MSAIRKSAISEVVYEHITQMLYDGIYPPGTPITRRELAEKMSVSPTPVGEAIARLVGEGIIEQIMYVSPYPLYFMRSLYLNKTIYEYVNH